jgi:hypothetical protein
MLAGAAGNAEKSLVFPFSKEQVRVTSSKLFDNGQEGKVHNETVLNMLSHNTGIFIPANTDKHWWGRNQYLTMLQCSNEVEKESNYSKRSAYELDNLGEVPEPLFEAFPSDVLENNNTTANSYEQVRLEGSQEFVEKLREVLKEYKDCFSISVRKEPAHLPPFELIITEDQWKTARNRLPPRRTDMKRAKAMKELITVLSNNDIIRPSSASHYSHGLIVPKVNGDWRLVVDFKGLNLLKPSTQRIGRFQILRIRSIG